MPPRFELFDHTADVGVRVFAPSLPELIAPATAGLYVVIGEFASGGPPAPRRFELTGDEPAMLLRDYLAELLNLFDTERLYVTGVEAAEFTQQRLTVTARVQSVNMHESVFEREVKAVTYHELAIRQTAAGYEATYIVDI